MIDNLLFFNLEESESENCTKDIQSLCKENLRLMEAEHFEFESVHRFWKVRNSRGRPIVAKFKNFFDKEAVRKASHKVRDSVYSISEQLPRKTANAVNFSSHNTSGLKGTTSVPTS